MASKKKIEVELTVDSTGAVTGIKTADGQILNLAQSTDKADKATSRLSNTLKIGLAASLVGVAVAARRGISVLGESVDLARVQTIAERKLEASLRNVGDATDEKQRMLQDLASEVQRYSNFGDESIITAQAMLGTFQLNADQIAVLTPRLADMAAGVAKATGETVDLNSIAQAVGKSFVEGASSLKRYGVSLTDTQEAAFNAADGMERVRLLSEILDGNFAGMAAATQDAGKQMENAIGDLKESLGKDLLPEIEGLQRQVTAFVQDPRIVEFARKTGSALVDLGKGVVRFFQFSIPIALGRVKAGLAGFAADAVQTTGKIVGVLTNPFDAVRGRDIANPYQNLIDSLSSVEESSRDAVDELINQELQQSANLIVAAHAAEQNRELANSINQVTAATANQNAAPPRPPVEVQQQEDIFVGFQFEDIPDLGDNVEATALLVTQVLGLGDAFDEVTSKAEENKDEIAEAQKEYGKFASNVGLAMGIIKGLNIENIKSIEDFVGAVLGATEQIIQAYLNQAIAAQAVQGFQKGPIIGLAAALLGVSIVKGFFSKAIKKNAFADGVTGFAGGAALVGERGPELVTLPSGSNVITNENTQKLLASVSGGGNSVAIVDALNMQTQAMSEMIEQLGIDISLRPAVAAIDPYQFKDDYDRFTRQQSHLGNTR